MKILFVGDIVGRCGIDSAFENIPDLKDKYGIDLCIVNAENAAGGFGATKETLSDLERAGADAFTLGNHAFSKAEILSVFEEGCFDIIRPANFAKSDLGASFMVVTAKCGQKVGVINVLGKLFVSECEESPFEVIDALVEKVKEKTDIIIVDIHAEATSEKKAMGYYLDGKVSAVFGTHTHIQTADEEIFKNGTAYITDVGMCGAKNSVLGAEISCAIAKFTHEGKGKYKAANGERVFCAMVLEVDEEGKAVSIERIRI